MQPAVLRALEFDRIRAALAHEASTPLGQVRARALEPSVEAEEVRARLTLATEAAAYLRQASLRIDAPDDLRDALAGLELNDQILEPGALLGLARFVESVSDVTARVAAADARLDGPSAFPRLAGIARRAASFEDEAAAVRRAIEPSGDVSDSASPALRDIRDKLRRQRSKLRSTLDGLARGRDTAKYVQDQIVTDRNGRYVLVIRAEHRDAIPGIVHGSSTSGASLYLEPLTTMGLNNDIVALAERERVEVSRILLALTNAFRLRPDELEATLDVAGELDALQAGARLAQRMDGIAPELVADGAIELRGARHPLLIPAVRDIVEDAAYDDADRGRSGVSGLAAPSTVVASDLMVTSPARALVISGPNTGGKTVALKALGLLSLMAQSGLLIPVEAGSRLTPFRSVFADIGDEQSIAASLSTFSAHIANLVAMERALEAPALVLLDEVGGGTDPVEGGALGTAVIDHFRNRGATVVATTHDDALKSYAATTEGVTTAAFGFAPDTYAPTYRLIYGAPGRSLALEIAERLGMPASVIADARARRSSRETQLATHLERIDKELAALEAERRDVAEAGQALDAERQALLDRETRLAEREAILKKRTDDRLSDKLREARGEVDRVVDQLKKQAGTLIKTVERAAATGATLTTGEVGQLRAGARHALDTIGDTHGLDRAADAGTSGAPLTSAPSIGQSVFVPVFGTEAVVTSVSGKHVEVDIKGKRMRVTLRDLRSTGPARTTTPAPTRTRDRVAQAGAVAGALVVATREIVVVGSTVDEASERIEKFLDDALLADEKHLRVVHGRGTGRLRDGVRALLKAHPMVAHVGPGADDAGGDAVTLVELRD